MDHAHNTLPAIRAPNAQGSKAQRVFQMEAQLALNQLVFEADQRRQQGQCREGASGSPMAVKNMHESSMHANEAQRLANQLLHRMMRQGSPEYSSDHNEMSELPPLRTAGHRSMHARPTLETAMRYAVAPAPVASSGARDSTSPQRKKSTKQQRSKPQPRVKQVDHRTPQSHVLSTAAEQHNIAVVQLDRQPSMPTVSPSPQVSANFNDAPTMPSNVASNHRSTPTQRGSAPQRVAHRTTPMTQLVESEAVERSIAITMWELERNKLYQRIAKAIAAYFLWLVDDLEEELLGAQGDVAAEEERRRTMIWNRYEIKNKAFIQRRVDDFYLLERTERDELVKRELVAHAELPKESGHDKFVIYEDENHDRKEVFNEESIRRLMLKTKFQMRETLMNESSLRKWIETLEDETFESSLIDALQRCWQIEIRSVSILRREQSSRNCIAAEYDADIPYFDRYQTQLTHLGGDNAFWNAKRDVEYHENLRRLFSVSGEHQERLELCQTFASFMQMRGALLSRATVQMILENEWMRRGLVVATESRAFATFIIAHARVVNDNVAEHSQQVREAANTAISNHTNEPRYALQRDVEDHEAIRRAFITREEAIGVVKLHQLLELFEEAEEQPMHEASRFSALLPEDPLKCLLFSEAQRRAYVHSKEHVERRAYTSVCTAEFREMMEDAHKDLTRCEEIRRCFVDRSEESNWHLLRKLHVDEIKRRRRFAQLQLTQNEDLRRDLVGAQELAERNRLRQACADGSDDEGSEVGYPAESAAPQHRQSQDIELYDLFEGEYEDTSAPSAACTDAAPAGLVKRKPSPVNNANSTEGHTNELKMEADDIQSLQIRESEIDVSRTPQSAASCKATTRALLLSASFAELTNNEAIRRCFVERSEEPSWRLLQKLHTDETNRLTGRRNQELEERNRSDGEGSEVGFPAESAAPQHRQSQDIELCDLFEGEYEDTSAPSAACTDAAPGLVKRQPSPVNNANSTEGHTNELKMEADDIRSLQIRESEIDTGRALPCNDSAAETCGIVRLASSVAEVVTSAAIKAVSI